MDITVTQKLGKITCTRKYNVPFNHILEMIFPNRNRNSCKFHMCDCGKNRILLKNWEIDLFGEKFPIHCTNCNGVFLIDKLSFEKCDLNNNNTLITVELKCSCGFTKIEHIHSYYFLHHFKFCENLPISFPFCSQCYENRKLALQQELSRIFPSFNVSEIFKEIWENTLKMECPDQSFKDSIPIL